MSEFYEEIECEHGWTDDCGFGRCDLGGYETYCIKEYCPIYEDEEEEENTGDSYGDKSMGMQ